MEKDRQVVAVVVVVVNQRRRRGIRVGLLLMMLMLMLMLMMVKSAEGVWCVARSGANDKALQSALDYACAGGADCGPIQQSGLCFLPNTLQAHASYAFNSFYQRNHMAATSCDFSATATLAKTDPSYGSCVYPSSPSTAGSITSNTTPTKNPYGTATPFSPTTMSPTTFGGGGGGGTGLTPNYMGPPISTTNESKAPVNPSSSLVYEIMLILLLLSLAIY